MSLFLCRFTKKFVEYMGGSLEEHGHIRLVEAETEEEASAKLVCKLEVDDQYGRSTFITVDEVTDVLS